MTCLCNDPILHGKLFAASRPGLTGAKSPSRRHYIDFWINIYYNALLHSAYSTLTGGKQQLLSLMTFRQPRHQSRCTIRARCCFIDHLRVEEDHRNIPNHTTLRIKRWGGTNDLQKNLLEVSGRWGRPALTRSAPKSGRRSEERRREGPPWAIVPKDEMYYYSLLETLCHVTLT